MALYCSRSRSYASSSRANPRKKNDDGVKLRAIFEQGTDEVQSAFKFAMLMHNQNLTSRRFELQAYVDVINTADAFKLSRLKSEAICAFLVLVKSLFYLDTEKRRSFAGPTELNSNFETVDQTSDDGCYLRSPLALASEVSRVDPRLKSCPVPGLCRFGASLFPQVALSCSTERIITASTTSALCSMGIELDGGARAAVAATARSPAARAAAARVGSCSKSCCSKSSCSKSRCRKSSCSKSSCRKSSCSKSRCNHRANCQKSRSIC
ncbi:unnamed protein product [Nesidiocoris tenuis]|uniref:Uncharacterized protein n=1 Tax=Nesidiocoris tenuis TaxID=355587 RepID=A0A6H5G3M7_9HEMI|nr:unnamed protein product [Nesidiocoris tenuis]